MTDSATNNRQYRSVLLLHGYPQPIVPEGHLYRYFSERGYAVYAPYLFGVEVLFRQNELKTFIRENFGKQKSPDIIAGVSLGGLIATQIAANYPDAKLILIGTGPYLKTKIGVLNHLLQSVKPSYLRRLLHIVMLTPVWLYTAIYKIVNKPKHVNVNSKELDDHIRKNWKCITKIPVETDLEIIRYAVKTDNSELLKSIHNKTLIFAGDDDSMMPRHLSEILHKGIKNSTLILSTNRLHYTVFTRENYPDIDRFLVS